MTKKGYRTKVFKKTNPKLTQTKSMEKLHTHNYLNVQFLRHMVTIGDGVKQ